MENKLFFCVAIAIGTSDYVHGWVTISQMTHWCGKQTFVQIITVTIQGWVQQTIFRDWGIISFPNGAFMLICRVTQGLVLQNAIWISMLGVFLQRYSFLEKGQWEGQWCLTEFLGETSLGCFPTKRMGALIVHFFLVATLKCDYNNTNDHQSWRQ